MLIITNFITYSLAMADVTNKVCGVSTERLEVYKERAAKFTPTVLPILERLNVDKKFIWLAIIESGANPEAESEHGAVGLWQLTAFTSKHYGCPPESRRNVVCSTQAAAKYISKLLRDFGGDKWKTIVGYNMGGSNYRRLGRPTSSARSLANTVTCLMENYEWDSRLTTTSLTTMD